jgi:hypothetical protein
VEALDHFVEKRESMMQRNAEKEERYNQSYALNRERLELEKKKG